MKKIFCNFFIFFLIWSIALFKINPASARTKNKNKILYLKIDITASPNRNFIRGWFSVKLAPDKVYQFNVKNLILEKVKLGKTLLKSPFVTDKGYLRIITTRSKRWLLIRYKLHVNFVGSPFNYIKNFFPVPDAPFKFKISFRLPKRFRKILILVPSEKNYRKKTRYYYVYYFKSYSSEIKPFLVIGSFKEKKLRKEKNYTFYYDPDFTSVSVEKLKLFVQNFESALELSEDFIKINFKYMKFVIFPKEWNIVKDLTYGYNIFLLNEKILERPYSLVHLLLKRKLLKSGKFNNNSLLEGLITYLVDYRTVPDKKEFRRKMLITGGENSRSFFYYFKIASAIGEYRFISALKNYLSEKETESVSEDVNSFIDYLEEIYYNELKFLPPYESFQKVKLKGKAQIYRYHGNTYLLYFFLIQSQGFRKIKVPVCIKTEDNQEEFILTMNNQKEIFQLALNSKPEEILIDPDFKLWRELEFEEIPVNFSSLERKPGILIYPKEKYPLYRRIINFFEDLGYQPYSQGKVLKFSQNLIYLEYSPFPWNFEKPLKGFYFKIIPNPWGGKSYVAYFYASSIKELEKGFTALLMNENVSEFRSFSGKIIAKKVWTPESGIKIRLDTDLSAIKIEDTLSPEDLVRRVLDSQVILINRPDRWNKKVLNFLKEFVELFYKYDSSVAIAVDLPVSLKGCVEEKKEVEEVESSCDMEKLSPETLEFIKLLKELLKEKKRLKVIFIGLPKDMELEILEKGLEGIEEKYKTQLPEMDLLNPPYKAILKSYYFSEKPAFFDFNKFYQLEVLKNEKFAENIANFLKKFRNYQVIALVPKLQLISPWGLIKSLKKREILHVKTIFLQNHQFIDIEGINYLIQLKE